MGPYPIAPEWVLTPSQPKAPYIALILDGSLRRKPSLRCIRASPVLEFHRNRYVFARWIFIGIRDTNSPLVYDLDVAVWNAAFERAVRPGRRHGHATQVNAVFLQRTRYDHPLVPGGRGFVDPGIDLELIGRSSRWRRRRRKPGWRGGRRNARRQQQTNKEKDSDLLHSVGSILGWR